MIYWKMLLILIFYKCFICIRLIIRLFHIFMFFKDSGILVLQRKNKWFIGLIKERNIKFLVVLSHFVILRSPWNVVDTPSGRRTTV